MASSSAFAHWEGDLKSGSGAVSIEPGCAAKLDFVSRTQGGGGMTPEALVGGALASCFAMAFAHALAAAGHPARRIEVGAEVAFERQGEAYAIAGIRLDVTVDAEGGDEAAISRLAEETRRTCPVARALAGVPIANTLAIRSPAQAG